MAQQEFKCCLVSCLAFATSIAVGQAPPVSFTPLNDLGTGLYLNHFQGGLYPGGSNDVPVTHTAEGLARALAIQPLNALGQPSADGKYVLLSIGMSNTQQEFGPFVTQATAHPDVNHQDLVVINGAQGGEPAQAWISPDAETFDRVAERLAGANVTESQVAAVWLEQANPGPTVSLPSADADAFTLLQHLGDIVRAARVRYPNLQTVFLSSRTYAGYATSNLNPEPYAYESGLAVKWLIEAQINQMAGGGIDPVAGDLDYTSGVVPWLAWGPYLWADGLNPRSDGLIWEASDFSENDGTHPSIAGREKVAGLLMDFMLNSAFTQPWFVSRPPGDYNDDGTVDAADYVVWRKTDGTQAGYDRWRSNFGTSSASGSVLGATGSTRLSSPKSASDEVPEGSSWLLALFAAALGTPTRVSRARRGNRAPDTRLGEYQLVLRQSQKSELGRSASGR